MRTLAPKTLYIFFCAVIFSACSGSPSIPMDADADVGQPEYDVTGLIEEWEGPIGINVFSSTFGVGPSTEKILISDFNNGIIFMAEEGILSPRPPVMAQRISAEGERMWSRFGTPVTSVHAAFWNGREHNLDIGAIPDRNGGAFILFEDGGSIDEGISIMGNHVFSDGSFLYPLPLFEQPIVGPHDAVKYKWISNSLFLGSRLLLNIWLSDGDYLSANGLNNICPVSVDELFQNPTPELNCLGMGCWGVSMLRISDSEAMYMTSANLYLIPDSQYWPLLSYLCGSDDNLRYNIINSDIQSVTGGEVEITPPLGREDMASIGGPIEYDMPSGGIFVSLHPIIKLQLTDHVLTYSWKLEDNIFPDGNLNSIRGDTTGGLYVASVVEWRDEDCLEIECCSREIDRCDTQLRVQLYDPEGFPVYPSGSTVIEIYRRITAPGQYADWDPSPIFSRSIDNEPDGSAIYFWMKPLVHEGAQYPDTYSYDLGYVICAQKATPESPAAWGDGRCVPVAQIFTNDDTWDYYAWFDAIDDGQGGSIIVYDDFEHGIVDGYGVLIEFDIRAQRISSSGQLLWNDPDGP